jgi:hypothetical protein
MKIDELGQTHVHMESPSTGNAADEAARKFCSGANSTLMNWPNTIAPENRLRGVFVDEQLTEAQVPTMKSRDRREAFRFHDRVCQRRSHARRHASAKRGG